MVEVVAKCDELRRAHSNPGITPACRTLAAKPPPGATAERYPGGSAFRVGKVNPPKTENWGRKLNGPCQAELHRLATWHLSGTAGICLASHSLYGLALYCTQQASQLG